MKYGMLIYVIQRILQGSTQERLNSSQKEITDGLGQRCFRIFPLSLHMLVECILILSLYFRDKVPRSTVEVNQIPLKYPDKLVRGLSIVPPCPHPLQPLIPSLVSTSLHSLPFFTHHSLYAVQLQWGLVFSSTGPTACLATASWSVELLRLVVWSLGWCCWPQQQFAAAFHFSYGKHPRPSSETEMFLQMRNPKKLRDPGHLNPPCPVNVAYPCQEC